MLPVPPHVVALVGVAVNVAADGAVTVAFTPVGDVQPFTVTVRLLYDPAATFGMVAAPFVTVTLVNEPPV